MYDVNDQFVDGYSANSGPPFCFSIDASATLQMNLKRDGSTPLLKLSQGA